MLLRFDPAIGDVAYSFFEVYFVYLKYTRKVVARVSSRSEVCNASGSANVEGPYNGQFVMSTNVLRTSFNFTFGTFSLFSRIICNELNIESVTKKRGGRVS